MAAPALRELQEAFWQALQPGAAPAPAFVGLITETSPLPRGERLDIYRGMYRCRILDALREDFPRLTVCLGDDGFTTLVDTYLAHHPSRHPSLRHVGRGLADLLAINPPPGTPPFAADLARLEWARLDVFDAPDAVPLTADALRAVPLEDWPVLRFTRVPACSVLVTAWPVHRVWAAPDAAPLAPARTALRLWRDGFVVYHAAMEAREETALGRLLAGESFATVCEVLEDPGEAAALLLGWVQDGLIAAATVGT